MTRKKVVRIAIMVVAFIVGFVACWQFLVKPMSDEQFSMCERVARDVYAQNGQVIVEVPENVHVSINTTSIKVKLKDLTYRGQVTAKLQNGELMITRDNEHILAVILSILVGILCLLICTLVIIIFEKKTSRKIHK